jgi:hypothetical protein
MGYHYGLEFFPLGKAWATDYCPSGGVESDEYPEIIADDLLSFRDDVLVSNFNEDTQPGDLLFMQDGAPRYKTADVSNSLPS